MASSKQIFGKPDRHLPSDPQKFFEWLLVSSPSGQANPQWSEVARMWVGIQPKLDSHIFCMGGPSKETHANDYPHSMTANQASGIPTLTDPGHQK
jgi:hypothetical protein